MTTGYPELASRDLVLWCVRRGVNLQLVCRVADVDGALALSVHSGTGRQTLEGETHADVVSLVRRADAIRNALLANGWTEADIVLQNQRT